MPGAHRRFLSKVNVAELAAARQELLGPTADRRAKETGCVQRERAFTGSGLVQALVFAAKQSIAGVYVPDGSVLALPHELGAIWSGCGGSKGANAAFKLGVRLDLVRGELRVCFLNGRSHDRRLAVQSLPLPAGAIRLADLGFFALDVFARIHLGGAYFLSCVRCMPR